MEKKDDKDQGTASVIPPVTPPQEPPPPQAPGGGGAPLSTQPAASEIPAEKKTVVGEAVVKVEPLKLDAKTPSDDDKVQINMLVPKWLKDMAQREAGLAFEYKWIEEPTLTGLFTWVIQSYLREGIKQFIEQRRKSLMAAGKETT